MLFYHLNAFSQYKGLYGVVTLHIQSSMSNRRLITIEYFAPCLFEYTQPRVNLVAQIRSEYFDLMESKNTSYSKRKELLTL